MTTAIHTISSNGIVDSTREDDVAVMNDRFVEGATELALLCNDIIATDTTVSDGKISSVLRQTLLNSGLEVMVDVLKKHRRRRSTSF